MRNMIEDTVKFMSPGITFCGLENIIFLLFSPLNKEEEKELEKFQAVRNAVHSKLQESGDLERLRCYVRRRLVATGWKDDRIKELRAAVKEIGTRNLSVEELHERVSLQGRNIDKRFEEEALREIKHSYEDAVINGGGSVVFEQRPNGYNKASVPKLRLNNRHRK